MLIFYYLGHFSKIKDKFLLVRRLYSLGNVQDALKMCSSESGPEYEAVRAACSGKIEQFDPKAAIFVCEHYLMMTEYAKAYSIAGPLLEKNNLEAAWIMMQIYIRINRLDLAEKLIQKIKSFKDESFVQLIEACFYISKGGECVNDAIRIIEGLIQKYSSSPFLSNALGICYMHNHSFEYALNYFQETNEQNPDFLANIVAAKEAANMDCTLEMNQLSKFDHPFTKEFAQKKIYFK